MNSTPEQTYSNWIAAERALVFVTCPRTPRYINATLASAYSTSDVAKHFGHVLSAVDASDTTCVADLEQFGGIQWIARTSEETRRIERMPVHQRACHNYWRALAIASPDIKGVLVCEDDIVFREGWIGMLIQAVTEMEAVGIKSYLLAAYSAYDHEHPCLRRGLFYSSYLAHDFFGTQAVYYPRNEIIPIRDLLWEHGVEVFEEPYDLLIKRRAIDEQHLYATRVSLVQHIGRASTGLGDGLHCSPTYDRPWPDAAVTRALYSTQAV